MAKKSYNPFKMWGSYVGAVLFFILGGMFYIAKAIGCGWDGSCSYSWGDILFIAIIFSVIGFLLGYGIHSLFRKLRSR